MESRNIQIFTKIISRAKEAISDTENMDYNTFLEDDKTIRAVVFSISQIGELVKALDENILNKYNNINWIEIRGLRNRIIHDYEGIQFRVIWEVIVEDLPRLIKDIKEIINKEK